MRWLAEATYTGEALEYALTNTIQLMRQENRVVLVLTDGRSDISRDNVPLNVLCGKNIRVSDNLQKRIDEENSRTRTDSTRQLWPVDRWAV